MKKVMEYRNRIGINPLIELVPVVRGYSEKGWSNPKKTVDRILRDLEESKAGQITYETLLNWIMDYLESERLLSFGSRKAKNTLGFIVVDPGKKLQVQLSDVVVNLEQSCQDIAESFNQTEQNNILVDAVPQIIRNRSIVYEEGFDKICFIIDRDKDSFLSHDNNNQYAYVKNKCKEKGFGFYLTNPCFEFWLLLHFDDVKTLDEEKLLNNPKVSSRRRYTEQELRNRMKNYAKSSYDTTWFMNRIDIAVENEKDYCEDENMLEYSIGNRVGMLIEEMRNADSR